MGRVSFVLFLLLIGGAALVSFLAEPPSRIDGSPEVQTRELQAVKLPPAPEAEEKKPPEPPPPTEPSADLAPESFSTASLVDQGFGASYGSGGGGPAIGGQGGFGTDAGALVGSAANADRPARVIARGELEYPAEAKTKGVQGFVIVRLLVGATGGLENAKIVESQPSGYFDQAVLRFVQSWRFEPGLKSGQVAATWLDQKVRFELD